MSTNISYYEKIKELQTVQHEKEQNRLDLERQLNAHLRSDHRLSKLKAVRLQNYWKKLCEDEKRSLQRNEQLQRDFERVEAHLARMEEKTAKLEKMKREYENYVERTYPNWKEIVMQQAQQATYAADEAQRQEHDRLMAGLQDPVPSYQQQQNIPSMHQVQVQPQHQAPSSQQYQSQLPAASQQQTQTAPLAYPMKNTVDSSTSYQQIPGVQNTVRSGVSHQQVHGAQRTVDSSTSYQQIPGVQQERAQQYPSQHQLIQQQPQQQPQQPPQMQQQQVSQQQQWQQKQHSQASIHRTSTPQLGHDLDQTDDLSDLSEDDAPLTPQDLEPAPVPIPRASASKESPLVTSAQHIGQGEETKRPCDLVPKPDVTVEGLINLINALEGDLANADSAQFVYRTDPPASSVFRDIINHGNRGAGLRHVNTESISMVILEQLPLLLAHTSSIGCMFPDTLLGQSVLPASAQDVKMNLPRENHELFDQLYDHFIKLLRHEVLTPTEIADIFGPALIAPQSTMENQSRKVLVNLLEHIDPSLLVTSARSTSTFSTIPSARSKSLTKQPSPTKQPSVTSQSSFGKQPSATSPQAKDPLISDHEENDENDEKDREEEIDHEGEVDQEEEKDLKEEKSRSPVPSPKKDEKVDSKKEESDEDSFFSQPVPKSEPAVNLTQSAAYQQMLSGSMRGPAFQDSEDSEDDIENQLGLSPPGGTSATLFSSGGAKSPEPEPPVVASPSPTPRAASLSESDDTPSFNSHKGGVNFSSVKPAESKAPPQKSEPQQSTGLFGSTLGSSLGSTAKSSKKPAFLGDSDTDVEIDVGASTKTSNKFGDEEDDFEFYS